jgi:hypothetical protein
MKKEEKKRLGHQAAKGCEDSDVLSGAEGVA